MFFEFFSKEITTALKRPMIYIFIGLLTLMVAASVCSDNLIIGSIVGNIYKNGPTVITSSLLILNVFGLFFATTFFNNAALRDHKYGFNEILFSTPLSKPGYFFGRFFGALVLSSFVMCGVFLGYIIGTFLGPAMGWIDPSRVGPIRWDVFVTDYFLFILPNMFVMGAIIFFLASKFKSTIISFVGTMLIIVGYIIGNNLAGDLDSEWLAGAVDIFGITPYSLDTKYFTPQERNTIGPSLTNHVFTNRLIWMLVGIVVTLFSYLTFSFKSKLKKASKKKKNVESIQGTTFALPAIQQNFSNGWTNFLSFFKISLTSIIKNNVFIILLSISMILLFVNLYGGFESYGLKEYPLTYKMIEQIEGAVLLFVIIVMVFFSGEQVWMDRDSHLNEVVDGTPHQSVQSLFAKAAALIVAGVLMNLVMILAGIIYQAANGFTTFKLGVYFTDFIWSNLTTYIFMAFLFLFIQVLVNNKYLGYFASIAILFGWEITMNALGIESNLIDLGGTPSLSYSDINGFGPVMGALKWFSFYWMAFGFLLLLIAGLFWPRGTNSKIKDRLSTGLKSFGKSYKGLIGFTSIVWVMIAGFIYYNTKVLNEYKTSDEMEDLRKSYEEKFKQYEKVPKLKITDIVYHFDIFPAERGLDAKAKYTAVNKDSFPINEMHFTIDDAYEATIDIPNATEKSNDKEFGYVIYEFDTAVQPGDTVNLQISTKFESKGFENEVSNTTVVENGTFFNHTDFLPVWGYAESYELQDKNTRKKLGLPKRERTPKLELNCSAACMKSYISDGSSDWINVETFISTSEDQIAVAPGSLINEKKENGRNHFQYKLDHKSVNFSSFTSARFEVDRKKWNGIDIEIYYHKEHAWNVNKMSTAVQRSLQYYTENFGPYMHKQARIIEFPRYASFAQAFPGTMPYSEQIGFVYDLEDEGNSTIVEAVVAHEMAHQYWAHQLIGAEMQGATMLSESFAEYSSLMVMKKYSTEEELADFLRYDMNRYLRGRSRESDKEVPLAKVENQGYIHYGKGSVILFALQEYIGEDKVNAALKSFLAEFAYQGPPYPTSHDFMRYIVPQIPDSLNYLVEDWFNSITLYDLRTTDASYKELPNGKYEVTMTVEGRKIKADSSGLETFHPIADWIDIGCLDDSEDRKILYRERIFLDQPSKEFTFVMDEVPTKAAIDPKRILIDRVGKDNEKTVVKID